MTGVEVVGAVVHVEAGGAVEDAVVDTLVVALLGDLMVVQGELTFYSLLDLKTEQNLIEQTSFP